uniref:28S ribosomal protein S22, mitochondrial n=1 Tax=Wuchereria bancrofti TaxID=6293 RepID=A0A1I8EIP0_WUCBA
MVAIRNLWRLLMRSKNCDHVAVRKSFYSAWIKCTGTMAETQQTDGGNSIDVERLFTRSDIQSLLKSLTGLNLREKLFKSRQITKPLRAHYALMTDEAYEKTVKSMEEIGTNFLQFVPVLEPRCSTPIILANDPEIRGFDNSKYVFTDLSFGLGIQVRSVVVRETDGTLRSATPEERDRMTRVYKGHPYRPIYEPPLFKDPYLQMALDRNDHEYVLDWACHYYLPNDPVFIKLCHVIFDRTINENKFANLHSTRHFGPFVFYIVLNNKFSPLLNHYAAEKRKDAANLVRLIKAIFPDEIWSCQMKDADDLKVLQQYAEENMDYKIILRDLIKISENKQEEINTGKDDASKEIKSEREHTSTINKESFASPEGPLGEMAETYDVRVVRGSFEAVEQMQKLNEKSNKGKKRKDKKNDKK